MTDLSGVTQEIGRWLFSILSNPAVSGFLGVIVGAWLTACIERGKSRLAFCERQLRELYSPLLGIRQEISVLSEFRQEIRNAAGKVWAERCEVARSMSDIGEKEKALESERKYLPSRVEYDNAQLRERLIPAYRKMVEHFRENYWLAEFETRKYFSVLVRFVEHWERYLSETHSSEVLSQVDEGEEKLKPFYEHLEDAHDRLRAKLESGKA
jgi:hypothetical protein